MKKFLSIIFTFMLIIFAFCLNLNSKTSAIAAQNFAIEYYQSLVLNDFAEFTSREPGSEGEKQASEYIKSEMDKISNDYENFYAISSASVNDGIQNFTFTSKFDGLNHASQNIVYFYDSYIQTNKKVILACNYDSVAFDYEKLETFYVESESINCSAGSVAVLLSLAKHLPQLNLPYDIEFVFFGAGESDNAGSNYYTKGIYTEDKQDILCMINIDDIVVGENLYFYNDELDTRFTDFVFDVFGKNDIDIRNVNLVHLGKTLLEYENKLGLKYNHIAIKSDNVNFMAEGIVCLNLFAGDYEEGIIVGRNEFNGKDAITYTKNDNLDYIYENYGETMVSHNLRSVHDGIVELLKSEGFEESCLGAQNSTKIFYGIFGNQEIIAYLTAVALIVMIAITIYIHHKFSLKSYEARIEPEFLSTVLSISQNVDETCSDEAVPKAVSQVVANDIKKDKSIKVKKHKKDS